MSETASKPSGFLSFTLHAHLPYVVNHGTWPHGLEWLLEAAAETYLPLLRMFRKLQRDGVRLRCNLNLTPVLLEQLAHPVFQAEFPRYLERKIAAAREDEAVFVSLGEPHYTELAQYWQEFFSAALQDFNALDGQIVTGFQQLEADGVLDIITCCATHGYLPLLGTDESVRAQVRTAVSVHTRHLGRAPAGMWVPECGYRPAGMWSFPVTPAGHANEHTSVQRRGIEQELQAADLHFFTVDTHLVAQSARSSSPYGRISVKAASADTNPFRSLYQPYRAAANVSVYGRDPHTGLQVWSGDSGYPADSEYLDFHKKRWPGGHRYWRVTGDGVDMAAKEPYNRARAAERVRSHADHFVHTLWEALEPHFGKPQPPVLSAPFDAELFGHWWFEGVAWLEAVARVLHDYTPELRLTTAAEYLDLFPAQQPIVMPEGSWGAGGGNDVWLNAETSWTYAELYAAELSCREICSGHEWRTNVLGERIVRQICRELLLLESSDWQFLITTGAARDYAEQRFKGHSYFFNALRAIYERWRIEQALSESDCDQLRSIEDTDNIFRDIDPLLWATDAC